MGAHRNSSLAGVLTHVEYIRKAIDALDVKITEHIKWAETRILDLDKRVQTLEDWKAIYKDVQDMRLKKWHFYLAITGLIVSTTISIIVLFLDITGGI